ncbi:hypothetical protein [Oscillatoria acuminata]|uniref:hypothetical protein n=1 Tax=Oscillatoria acuminata TaxID=118323 RepID=UPI0012EAA414|nr:hypothetical protein [Oscillatoria acuminata]
MAQWTIDLSALSYREFERRYAAMPNHQKGDRWTWQKGRGMEAHSPRSLYFSPRL